MRNLISKYIKNWVGFHADSSLRYKRVSIRLIWECYQLQTGNDKDLKCWKNLISEAKKIFIIADLNLVCVLCDNTDIFFSLDLLKVWMELLSNDYNEQQIKISLEKLDFKFLSKIVNSCWFVVWQFYSNWFSWKSLHKNF